MYKNLQDDLLISDLELIGAEQSRYFMITSTPSRQSRRESQMIRQVSSAGDETKKKLYDISHTRTSTHKNHTTPHRQHIHGGEIEREKDLRARIKIRWE